MREEWTNLILKLTSYIYQKKKALLTSHAIKAITDVLIIVTLEIVLAIISIPLYIVAKETKEGDRKQYKVRRIISLSILILILILWLIKLLSMIIIPIYFDTSKQFKVETRGVIESNLEEYIVPSIYALNPNDNIRETTIETVKKIQLQIIRIEGQGVVDSDLILSITPQDNTDNLPTYIILTQTDSRGAWEATIGLTNIQLEKGSYIAEAITYDRLNEIRSNMSDPVLIEIENSFKDIKWFEYLNYIVMIFLLLGIINIILLI